MIPYLTPQDWDTPYNKADPYPDLLPRAYLVKTEDQRAALAHFGYSVCSDEETAYKHWLAEMAAFDQQLDISGEGKWTPRTGPAYVSTPNTVQLVAQNEIQAGSLVVDESGKPFGVAMNNAKAGDEVDVSLGPVSPVSVGYNKAKEIVAEVKRSRADALKKSRETFRRSGRG